MTAGSVRVSLASWLLERIAEEEKAARAASADQVDWLTYTSNYLPSFGEMRVFADRQSPARVLAECAAKRAIVEHSLCRPMSLIRNEYRTFTFLPSDGKPGIVEQWTRDEEVGLLQIVREWRDEDYWNTVLELVESPILRLLALPYADEPGYRAEWAVSP